MSSKSFEKGIETKSLRSGWMAAVKHGDGRVTKFWGVTEEEAKTKAQDHLIREDMDD